MLEGKTMNNVMKMDLVSSFLNCGVTFLKLIFNLDWTVPRCSDPPCRLFQFRFSKLSLTSLTFYVPVGA